MDWNLLGLSFVTVFLAELGDKSQVAVIALGGSSKFPRSVFFGTAAALVLASFLGVLMGEGVSQLLPTKVVKLVAATGFFVMALRLLLPQGDSEGDAEVDHSGDDRPAEET